MEQTYYQMQTFQSCQSSFLVSLHRHQYKQLQLKVAILISETKLCIQNIIIQLLKIQTIIKQYIRVSLMEGKYSISSRVSAQNTTKIQFKNDVQQFDSTYAKNDAVQREMSKDVQSHFIQLIKKKYQFDRKPLSILDYCCGHGKPTMEIVSQLLKCHVGIEKVRGYDISKDNIQYGRKNNPFDFLTFSIKNLDTEFEEVDEYDVILSIFGLHWINDTKSAIKNIYRSLKPDGIILFQIGLEHLSQYDWRQKFISSPRWTEQFNPNYFQLPKFHEQPDIYREQFKKYFQYMRDEIKVFKKEMKKQQFKVFYKSFLPEIRHFIFGQKTSLKKQILTQAFLNQFYESIPEGYDAEGFKKQGDKIFYTRNELIFIGKKLKNKTK